MCRRETVPSLAAHERSHSRRGRALCVFRWSTAIKNDAELLTECTSTSRAPQNLRNRRWIKTMSPALPSFRTAWGFPFRPCQRKPGHPTQEKKGTVKILRHSFMSCRLQTILRLLHLVQGCLEGVRFSRTYADVVEYDARDLFSLKTLQCNETLREIWPESFLG